MSICQFGDCMDKLVDLQIFGNKIKHSVINRLLCEISTFTIGRGLFRVFLCFVFVFCLCVLSLCFVFVFCLCIFNLFVFLYSYFYRLDKSCISDKL